MEAIVSTLLVSRNRFLLFFLAWLTCPSLVLPQRAPLLLGELNVTVLGPSADTVTIHVSASTVHGSRTSWYPDVDDWKSYHDCGTFAGQHIDRLGGPNEDTIGYAKYYIRVRGCEIYVDFRDADYGTTAYTELDIFLHYSLNQDKFYQLIDSDTLWINDSEGVGIWENGRKSSSSPRIPVTVTTSMGYGMVTVDESSVSVPHRPVWSLGSHDLDAYQSLAGNRCDWVFSYWSDEGARQHTVSTGVEDFGKVYTAFYYAVYQKNSDQSSPLSVYPNPSNPGSWITYSLRERSSVRLSIFDITGREVVLVADESQSAGIHQRYFNGHALASGVYWCRLVADNRTQIVKMLLLK
jgi:hypothetical protein